MLTTSLGGAISLTISQAIFNNDLVKQVIKYAPSVNPALVLNTGATEFRNVIPADAVNGVIQAYAKAIDTVLIPPIAFAGLALIVALGVNRFFC